MVLTPGPDVVFLIPLLSIRMVRTPLVYSETTWRIIRGPLTPDIPRSQHAPLPEIRKTSELWGKHVFSYVCMYAGECVSVSVRACVRLNGVGLPREMCPIYCLGQPYLISPITRNEGM